MGRTKRQRTKRRPVPSLDHEDTIVNLRKWMCTRGWTNETQLQLRLFPETGRGVTSRHPQNGCIISIPYDLMITFTTVCQSDLTLESRSYTMHDLLVLFLLHQKHKETSKWKPYIESLPSETPDLPWLTNGYYPDDARSLAENCSSLMNDSLMRLQPYLNTKQLPDFKWAYAMVNTRAVYVDPDVVRSKIHTKTVNVVNLIGEPSMALAPFLDMFNHSHHARTEAEFTTVQGELFYSLTTLTPYKKREQIFISYGGHDNLKLVMEYGFFIPGNPFDCVKFEIGEILRLLKVTLCERRWKFLSRYQLDLNLGVCGPSFNLKVVLFVVYNEDIRDYSAVVYSARGVPGDYPEAYRRLLTAKLGQCEEWGRFEGVFGEFLRYRRRFIESLLCDLGCINDED